MCKIDINHDNTSLSDSDGEREVNNDPSNDGEEDSRKKRKRPNKRIYTYVKLNIQPITKTLTIKFNLQIQKLNTYLNIMIFQM